MSIIQYANNARSTLASSISSGATSATLSSGTGVLFPSLTPPQYFRATIQSPTNATIFENVKVTLTTGDVMTIVRAQEGTSAQAWGSGSQFNLFLTAADMQNFVQFDDLPIPHNDTFVVGTGGVTVGQTAFILSATPPSINYLTTVVDGSTLTPGIDVTLSGSVATLSFGLTSGQTANFNYWAVS